MQLDLTAILTVIYTGYPCPPHSSSAVYGPVACLIQKYFRNNFRLKIKNLKNIEPKKNSAFFFKKGRIERNQSSSSSNIQ